MAPLPRFDKLPPEKQHQLLEAAADEFALNGYEAASLNRIIAAAGVSKGAMYYYFADKADVYGAVLDAVFDRVLEVVADIERPTDAPSFWRALQEGLDRLNRLFFEDERMGALGRGLYQGGTETAVFRRLTAKSAGWVNDLLVVGQEVGAVRRDLPLELLGATLTGMLTAMDRWMVEAMDERDPTELMALAPKIMELIRDLAEDRPERQP